MSFAFIGFVVLIFMGFSRRKKKESNYKKYFMWSVVLLAVSLVSYLFVDDTKFQPTAEELAAQEEEKEQKEKEKEAAQLAKDKEEEAERDAKEAEEKQRAKEKEEAKLAKEQKEIEEKAAKETEEKVKKETVDKDTETKEVSVTKIDKEIKIEEELSFHNYKIDMDTAHIYEKDNKSYIDITFEWLNLSFPDKTTFLRAASVDVHQGDKVLQETTEAWSNPDSDVYFPNAVGGSTDVNLTYELKDISTPIKIVFVTNDEHDKNQEITIKIK